MFRTLFALVMLASPAYAGGAYYSDDMPTTSIHPIEGGYIISEGTKNLVVCVPYDKKWHICDERKDYLVHFEKRGDEIWISQPAYPKGDFAKFRQ